MNNLVAICDSHEEGWNARERSTRRVNFLPLISYYNINHNAY